jgi:hypothetical protein
MFSMNCCTYVYACSIIVSYILYACDNFQVHDSFHVNNSFVGLRCLHLLKHNGGSLLDINMMIKVDTSNFSVPSFFGLAIGNQKLVYLNK